MYFFLFKSLKLCYSNNNTLVVLFKCWVYFFGVSLPVVYNGDFDRTVKTEKICIYRTIIRIKRYVHCEPYIENMMKGERNIITKDQPVIRDVGQEFYYLNDQKASGYILLTR